MTELLSDEDLARYRALLEAATPGEWFITANPVGKFIPVAVLNSFDTTEPTPPEATFSVIAAVRDARPESEANAALIAAAPELVAALLAEVAALRDANAEYAEAIGALRLFPDELGFLPAELRIKELQRTPPNGESARSENVRLKEALIKVKGVCSCKAKHGASHYASCVRNIAIAALAASPGAGEAKP